MSRVGRNDPCPCGSGRKYKKCCGAKQASQSSSGASTPFLNPSLLAQQWLQARGQAGPTTLVTDHFEVEDATALVAVRSLGRKEGDNIVFYRKKEWMAEIDLTLPGQLILTARDTTEADRISEALKLMNGLRFVARSEDRFEPLSSKDKGAIALEMLEFKKKFFNTWLDEPNQRLENLTPRQAAATASRRPALLALLSELEARENDLPRKERFSFRAIRSELDL